MNVTGQPAPLDLLRLDHLLDEVLVRTLASHQLAVQSGLVQRARDEPPDDQQQLDIAVGEFASLDRVHVQHADQAAGIGLHRNRDHRGEVRSAQRLERHVTGIGLFVVADDHRFAVAGHPSGDALAQRQPDLADLGVERRCRTGQRQRPVGVVEHVDEAHIAGGGGGDHPGRRRGQGFDAGSARRGLDQLAKQSELAIGVDEIANGVGATLGRASSCLHR